jgi:flagellar hook assembly protein FlgD
METSAIGGTALAPADRGLASMKSEDFFRILVAELQQQDPFEPAKTSDMISQVSQVRSIELNSQLSGTLQNMAQQQRTAGASELLGKHVLASVEGPTGEPQAVAGVVTGVQFSGDGVALLELDSGTVVRAIDVVHVTTLEQAEAALQAAANAPANANTARQRNPLAELAAQAKQAQAARWWDPLGLLS